MQTSLMILIAGPYRSGTRDDAARIKANLTAMEEHALPLSRAGHIPVVGEWFALPLLDLAGSTRVGDASAGADEMVRLAQSHGRAVFHRLEEIPGCM